MSANTDGEAELPPLYRVASVKGFLPLSGEDGYSPRSSNLQGLITSKSQRNLAHLRAGSLSWRRRSSIGDSDRHRLNVETRPNDDDLESQPPLTPQRRMTAVAGWGGADEGDRRNSNAASILMTPQMRSQRLIGNSNPRYRWQQYWKSEEQLSKMSKPLRKYYERNNYLIQHYLYIDRLLDSSLPHNLIQEYQSPADQKSGANAAHLDYGTASPMANIPEVLTPEANGAPPNGKPNGADGGAGTTKVKRTPRDLYRIQEDETAPLIVQPDDEGEDVEISPPELEVDDEADSQSTTVIVAIYLNLAANTVLLAMKIVVAVLTSSVSVLASLVDAALDFLSTAIVWTTTRLISTNDQYAYPIGRRRLEPIGVLVFSVIMITSFVQVALEGLNHLTSSDHTIVQLSTSAIVIMAATVVIKGLCWLWCRLINNSSVQALAQDAVTDVIFNIFSIIFPLIGFYARIWWLDPLGGILLSFYVIFSWSSTSSTHIRNLTGAAATADERNILLYLTMRFAKTVKQIQGLQAYHSGDKLNVEVDIVLDESTSLRDSHDLGESLQYVLESVPTVDRAFVHLDYASWNLPSHMRQV